MAFEEFYNKDFSSDPFPKLGMLQLLKDEPGDCLAYWQIACDDEDEETPDAHFCQTVDDAPAPPAPMPAAHNNPNWIGETYNAADRNFILQLNPNHTYIQRAELIATQLQNGNQYMAAMLALHQLNAIAQDYQNDPVAITNWQTRFIACVNWALNEGTGTAHIRMRFNPSSGQNEWRIEFRYSNGLDGPTREPVIGDGQIDGRVGQSTFTNPQAYAQNFEHAETAMQTWIGTSVLLHLNNLRAGSHQATAAMQQALQETFHAFMADHLNQFDDSIRLPVLVYLASRHLGSNYQLTIENNTLVFSDRNNNQVLIRVPLFAAAVATPAPLARIVELSGPQAQNPILQVPNPEQMRLFVQQHIWSGPHGLQNENTRQQNLDALNAAFRPRGWQFALESPSQGSLFIVVTNTDQPPRVLYRYPVNPDNGLVGPNSQIPIDQQQNGTPQHNVPPQIVVQPGDWLSRLFPNSTAMLAGGYLLGRVAHNVVHAVVPSRVINSIDSISGIPAAGINLLNYWRNGGANNPAAQVHLDITSPGRPAHIALNHYFENLANCNHLTANNHAIGTVAHAIAGYEQAVRDLEGQTHLSAAERSELHQILSDIYHHPNRAAQHAARLNELRTRAGVHGSVWQAIVVTYGSMIHLQAHPNAYHGNHPGQHINNIRGRVAVLVVDALAITALVSQYWNSNANPQNNNPAP